MKKNMSKPVVPVKVSTVSGLSAKVRAIFDSGSERTFIRQDALPAGATFELFPTPHEYGTAGPERLRAVGALVLDIEIGTKRIETTVLVAPKLPRAVLIGSGTMQEWHISIVNGREGTRVQVGRHLDHRDVRNFH